MRRIHIITKRARKWELGKALCGRMISRGTEDLQKDKAVDCPTCLRVRDLLLTENRDI